MKQLLLFFAFIFCFTSAFCQPGTLDASFGNEGKVVTGNDQSKSYQCFSATLQNNNKIILGGNIGTFEYSGFGLRQYLPNGQTDVTFGETGEVITSFADLNYFYSEILATLVQPDGKIVAAGRGNIDDDSFPDPRVNIDVLLARYMPDGSLDSSFGENGKVTTDFRLFEYGNAVALQPDGKIVVGGKTGPSALGIFNFLLLRYMPDGRLDASFGDGGRVVTDLNGSNHDVITSIAIQSDGKIVAGGSSTFVGGYTIVDFALARYNANGSLDASFGNNGIVITDIDPNGDAINSIALQDDEKIIAAGIRDVRLPNTYKMAISRYNSNGSLDKTFNNNGIVTIRFEEGASIATSVSLQKNRKIVIGGTVAGSFGVARLLEDGSLDSSFSSTGKNVTDIYEYDQGRTLLLQNDGKLILTGQSIAGIDKGIYSFALARYHGDPVENPVIAQLKTWLRNNTLGWYTSNNSSVNYYSVQRSPNGSSFKEEKRVQANNSPRLLQQANTREQQTFTYALNTAATNSYYRVAAVLKDGSTAFSPVVYYGSGKHITLYPNPVKEVLTVKGLQPEVNNLLTISDVGGNVLLSTTVTSSATYNYNVSRLKAGQYVLRVQSTEQVQTCKVCEGVVLPYFFS